jgi:hypothetical protein
MAAAAVALLLSAGSAALAAGENFISYLGAAWGPDGDTIYCVKQISFSPSTLGKLTQWVGVKKPQGRQLWLCKMKWDGSDRQEICELWPGQGAFVDTQSGPLWMEVNTATSNVAFSVEYGNEVSGGLWIIGMDGRNMHRPFPLVWNEQARWAPLHPSWSPDGMQIVYEEDDRAGVSGRRLVLYDLQKKERRQLTDGPNDQHPVWSPKGDWIAFAHNLYDKADKGYYDRRIWLIRPDGSGQRPVVDEKGKTIFGWWPSWNPEGAKVSIGCRGLALASLSQTKVEWIDPLPIFGDRSPYAFMAHQWGKHGWMYTGSEIRLVSIETRCGRFLTISGLYKMTDPKNDEARWGGAPRDIPPKVSK